MTTVLPPAPSQPELAQRASRWPAVVVFVLASIYPTTVMINVFIDCFSNFPLLAAISAVCWILYAIPFIILLRMIDFFEREPWSAIALAIFWGAIVACGMSIVGNQHITELVVVNNGTAFSNEWSSAIGGPTEELTKGAGILLVLMLSPRRPRTALDGFIIGAIVGLSFQIVENFIYTVNNAQNYDSSSLYPLLLTFFSRGVIGGLFSHAVYSGIVGLGLGYLVSATHRTWPRRIGAAVLGLVVAWGMHLLWNTPDFFGGQWGQLLSMAVKGLPILVLLFFPLRAARRRDSAFFIPYLLHVDDSLVTNGEALALTSLRARRRAVELYTDSRGRHHRRQIRRIQRAQADLAVALSARNWEKADDAVGRIRSLRPIQGIPVSIPTDLPRPQELIDHPVVPTEPPREV